MSFQVSRVRHGARSSLASRAVRTAVLIAEMAGRSFRLRFAGSYLGLLWSVLGPLLNALVTATIFYFLMRGRLGGQYARIPFPVYFFVGFSIWGLMTEVMMRGTTIVLENAALITKISFPTSILPPVAFAGSLINFAVYLAIAVAMMLAYHASPSSHLYVAVVWFAIAALLATGVAYLVAAVGVFVRDIAPIMPVVLNILYYLSPIMYSPSVLRAGAPHWVARLLLDINPLSRLIEGWRSSFIEVGAPVDFTGLACVGTLAMLVFAGGFFTYRVLKPSFADVL